MDDVHGCFSGIRSLAGEVARSGQTELGRGLEGGDRRLGHNIEDPPGVEKETASLLLLPQQQI